MNHLIALGLIEKGPLWLHGQTYRVTDEGKSVVYALDERGPPTNRLRHEGLSQLVD